MRPFLKQTGWFSSRGGSNEEMISSISENRECYPYTLNLLNGTVMFFDYQKTDEKDKAFDINLNEVRNELESLKKDIEYFKEAIYNF